MNRGFMALGYIIVLFIAVLSISFYFSMRVNTSSVTRKRVFFKGALDSLALSVEASFKSQSAWIGTVQSPLNKNGADLEKCMNDPSFACPAGEYPLSVIDDAGNTLVDSSSASNGFDIDFKPCTTYGTPNSACFLRYEVTWAPECPAVGLCYSPPIHASMKVLIDASVAGAVNLNVETYTNALQLR